MVVSAVFEGKQLTVPSDSDYPKSALSAGSSAIVDDHITNKVSILFSSSDQLLFGTDAYH